MDMLDQTLLEWPVMLPLKTTGYGNNFFETFDNQGLEQWNHNITSCPSIVVLQT
jgi:hypothetical protein